MINSILLNSMEAENRKCNRSQGPPIFLVNAMISLLLQTGTTPVMLFQFRLLAGSFGPLFWDVLRKNIRIWFAPTACPTRTFVSFRALDFLGQATLEKLRPFHYKIAFRVLICYSHLFDRLFLAGRSNLF